MKIIIQFILVVFAVVSVNMHAQQTPADPQEKVISIQGATAHIGNGQQIENAVIVFENAKITYVGTDQSEVKGKTIKAEGKHVYPGFIAPNSTLGLVEVDAVRASDDESELGKMLPHVRSIIAYNTESKIVESMRPNGVLMGQITPRGGRISGTSSIVQFDAWNWEDAILKENDGIHVNWPSGFTRSGNWYDPDRPYKQNKEYQKEVNDLVTYFKNAKVYKETSQEIDIAKRAMQGVFNGDKNIFIHANGEKEIRDVISFKKEFGFENLTIVGGYQAHYLADELKDAAISVLIQRVHSVPNFEDDAYDLPYKLPKLLNEAGVLVALEGSGDMERQNSRNLPFYAGTAVAYGLDKDEALKMVTLNTAKILGIDDQVGSLEVGKDATLFISEGDALEMRGNRLMKAFIQGRDISLETHQTELYHRYSEKYDNE